MTVPSWLPDAFQPTCRPSSTATLAPSRAASSATVNPASPAPTTAMSTSSSKESRDRCGRSASDFMVDCGLTLGCRAHIVFLQTDPALVTLCGAAACTLMRGLEPNRDAPCAV